MQQVQSGGFGEAGKRKPKHTVWEKETKQGIYKSDANFRIKRQEPAVEEWGVGEVCTLHGGMSLGAKRGQRGLST